MNETLRAAMDVGIATISRVTEAPSPPFGFGADIASGADLILPVRDVDPMSREAIALALLRRLDCPKGGVVDAPDYGIDLVQRLNRGQTEVERNATAGAVRNELEKDDRVVSLTVRTSGDSQRMIIDIRVFPADPNVDEFSLTFAATSAGVVLDRISE